MFKFIHDKHMHHDKNSDKIIIYYNASDMFLGTILLILVVFFIHDYLSHSPGELRSSHIFVTQSLKDQSGIKAP